MGNKLILPSLIGALMLTGCSLFVSKSKTDGAPKDIDVSRIKDPTPQIEPYSRGANPKSYQVFGKTYKTLPTHLGYEATGTASWYGTKFHGRKTSNGEIYDVYGMTAAHKSLPLPSYARVTNLENGKSVIVRINDRGPFVDDRLIDLTYTAAKKLGFHQKGTAKVKVTALDAKKHSPAGFSGWLAKQFKTKQPVYLQLGAFKSSENAEKLVKQVNASIKTRTPIRITQAKHPKQPLYKVIAGPFENDMHAEAVRDQLQAFNSAATIMSEL